MIQELFDWENFVFLDETWNKKVASNWLPLSFVLTEEYEMFWFDLASTFDYSDMAAMIAPRPFIVERAYPFLDRWLKKP